MALSICESEIGVAVTALSARCQIAANHSANFSNIFLNFTEYRSSGLISNTILVGCYGICHLLLVFVCKKNISDTRHIGSSRPNKNCSKGAMSCNYCLMEDYHEKHFW